MCIPVVAVDDAIRLTLLSRFLIDQNLFINYYFSLDKETENILHYATADLT